MKTIQIAKRDVKVVKSTRNKYMRLSINHMGEIKLSVPLGARDNHIIDFLREKSLWVENTLKQIQTGNRLIIRTGEKLNLLDTEYTLQVVTGHPDLFVKLDHERKLLYVFSDANDSAAIESCVECNKAIKAELIHYARSEITRMTREVAELMGAKYGRISIREQKTRWGSCSSKGNLNFNWKIVLAPERITRYVVVHEIAHLFQHNHSSKFWDIVAKYHPDYKEDRDWLKENGGAIPHI